MNSWLSQTLVECIGWTLVHFIWQGLAIAAALGVALRLMRSASSHARYLSGCFALLLMACAPVVTFRHLADEYPLKRAAQIQNASPQHSDAAPARSEVQTKLILIAQPAKHTRTFTEQVEQMFPWLVLSWSLGVFALSLRLLGGWLQIHRLRRVGISTLAPEWQEKLVLLAERLGVQHPVRLFQSALVEAPVMLGWLCPMILLPASCLTGLTPAQLESILAHELAHIRRHDYLVNLLQSALETILFYHPAVWWVSRKVREEREHCCDDLAVEVCGDRVVYARALAALEELRLPASLALGASGPRLLPRIRRLAGQSPSHAGRPAWPVAGIIALILIAAMAVGLRGNRAVAQENTVASTNRTSRFTNHLTRIVNADRRQQIMSKLDSIEVDTVQFNQMPLGEIIKYLNQVALRQDPAHVGINFFFERPTSGSTSGSPVNIDPATGLPVTPEIPDVNGIIVTIDPPLHHLRLADVLDVITKTADHPIRYSVLDYAVAFSLKNPNEDPLEMRAFHVDPNTFRQGLEAIRGVPFGNVSTGGGGAVLPQADVTGSAGSGKGPSSALPATELRQFIAALGMDMNSNNPANVGKMFVWNDRKGTLLVRSTAKDLDAIESGLQLLNTSPEKFAEANGAGLETKSFHITAEIDESTRQQLRELADTNVTTLNPLQEILARAGVDFSSNNPATRNRLFIWDDRANTLTVRGTPQELRAVEKLIESITHAPTSADHPMHIIGPEKVANEVNIQAKYIELNQPPNVPLCTGLYQNSSNSTVGPVTAILTREQYKAAIEALEHRNDANEFNAPEITTLAGRQAQVSIHDDSLQTNGILKDNKLLFTNDPPSLRQWFDSLGYVLDVIPSIGPDGWSIELALTSTTKEWVTNNGSADPRLAVGDFADKGSPEGAVATPTAAGAPEVHVGLSPVMAATVPPIFRTLKKASTNVKVWDGQTVMVAGLSSADAKSHANKYLILFVTPTLINPNGTRIHSDADVLAQMKVMASAK